MAEQLLSLALDKSLEIIVRKMEKGERLKAEDLAVLTIAVVRDLSRRIDETNRRIDETNKRIDALADSLNTRISELDERLNRRIDMLDEKLGGRI
ncbi:MAG: hypothetical protein QW394_08880, partial [Thermofilaceae archaeon]